MDYISRPTLTYEQFLKELNKKINSANIDTKIDIGICQFSNVFRFVADIGAAGAAGVATAINVFPYLNETFRDYVNGISNFETNALAQCNALGLWGLDFIKLGLASVATVGAGVGALLFTDAIIRFLKNKLELTNDQVEILKDYLDILKKRKKSLKKTDNDIEQLLPFSSIRKNGNKLFSQEDVERSFYLLGKYSLTTIIYALDQGILDRLELNLTDDVVSTINYTSTAKLAQLHSELESVKAEAQDYFAKCFDEYYNYRCVRNDYDARGYRQRDCESNRNMTFPQVIQRVYQKIDKALKSVNKEIEKLEKSGQFHSMEFKRACFMKNNLEARMRKLDCFQAYEDLIRDNQKGFLFNEETAQLIFEYLTFCSIETLILATFTGRLEQLDYLNYISYKCLSNFENPIPVIEAGVAEIYECERMERVRLQEASCEGVAQYINHITTIENKRYA